MSTFDRGYAERARAYAQQPFWFTEAAHLYQAVMDDADGGWVLDLGCNTGEFSRMLAATHRFTGVAALDINRDAIAIAKQSRRGVEFKLYEPADPFPWRGSVFHAVLMHNVIGHCRDVDHVLSEAHRVLQPGGVLAIVTPNLRHYQVRYAGRTKPGDSTMVQDFTPRSLAERVEAQGFRVRRRAMFGRSVLGLKALRSRILIEAVRP